MNLTPENLLSNELVGLCVEVVESTDPGIQGLRGTVVYETKNMMTIRTDEERIKYISKKAARTIQIDLPSRVCFISGMSLIGRPEDRISRLTI